MAKTKLFDLIQSMSMSEKRFFKIFSSRHVIGKKNDYVKLFDLIESMESYDDEKVRKSKFVKNASAEKNYLYQLVMKSLTVFHNQSSSKTKVYHYLISIEVLFQKGLYDQCLELIKKAKKIAWENELFRQLLTLSEIEQEVLLKDLKYEEALNSMKEDRNTIEKINNIADITYLTTKGYKENLSIGVARKEEQLKVFRKLLKHPFLKNKKESLSARARLYQMSLKMTYNMISGEHTKVIDATKAILKYYESHPHLIEYTAVGYVSSNFILGAAYRDKNDLRNALKQANKLAETSNNEFVQKSQKAATSALYYQAILYLQVMLKQNQFEKALQFYHEKADELKEKGNFIGKPQLYDLYFQYCKLFFVTGDYKRTLKFTNEILNDLKFRDRDDFSITLRLFNLIVHFELDNDFTLEYLSKSTYNYLKRKKKLFKAEKSIIRFLENYYKYEHRNEVQDRLEELKAQLEALANDKYEKGAFRLFDFTKWVDSKLENKELSRVV